ncbi:MAG: hydroxymethylglutaryl-CoA lyase [Gammaproteobacteria bacterium]|nr:hydroxymethylglutaryl-CoA lyase [Gammaproteobacteria bacterium]
MSFPSFVEIHEEGPREGFQIEKKSYPIADRVALVDALAASGLRQIQVGSFVSPRHVPTMADTAEMFEQLVETCGKRDGVRYTALWLNERGFERALQTPGVDLDGKILFYASDAFSRQNNGCGADEMRDRQRRWVQLYDERQIPVESAYIMTAFGCNVQGAVPLQSVLDTVIYIRDLCRETDRPLPHIVLADTVGWADPEAVKTRVQAVRELLPQARIGLHLHDTRGLGIANVYAALQIGVDLFDASVAGLGGCPFAAHSDQMAAGNVSTEDLAFLCERLGIETGIDLDALIEAARLAERVIGRRLNGSIMHAGRPKAGSH